MRYYDILQNWQLYYKTGRDITKLVGDIMRYYKTGLRY